MRQKRILVIDDEEGMLLLYKLEYEDDENLKRKYSIEFTPSPFMIQNLISNGSQIDLIITDIQLPGMNGFEVLGNFRNGGMDTDISYCDVKVILWTATPRDYLDVDCYKPFCIDGDTTRSCYQQKLYGITWLLHKTSDVESFFTAIEHVLSFSIQDTTV